MACRKSLVLRSDLTHTEMRNLIAAVPREPRHLSFLVDAETTAAGFFQTLLREETGDTLCTPQRATELGQTVLQVLERLFFVISETSGKHQNINALALSVGLWIAKRQGEIREMGLVVNGLAMTANGARDRGELEALYEISLHIVHAADPFLKADVNKHQRHRPWRLLCLNHCIIATRTGDGELAKAAYDFLIAHLPEEAGEFFEMGMRKIAGGQYSAHCRKIMRAYYETHADSARRNPSAVMH